MQKITLQEALRDILRQDSRYTADAYVFLKESLDHTIRMLDKPADGVARHVTASELLEGIREYALAEFGPMTMTVLNTWGLKTTEDIGNVVFNMVRQGILGKTEHDRFEDFAGGYVFTEVFRKPFLPVKPTVDAPARTAAAATGTTPRQSAK